MKKKKKNKKKVYVLPAKTQIRLSIRTERTAKTLIRLGGCPGCSESFLGAHAILLVLSLGVSLTTRNQKNTKVSIDVSNPFLRESVALSKKVSVRLFASLLKKGIP